MLIVNIAEISVNKKDRPKPTSWTERHAKELLEGIRENGIRVPLLVEKLKNGKYKIIDGFSRYNAALQLRMTQIPVELTTPKRE